MEAYHSLLAAIQLVLRASGRRKERAAAGLVGSMVTKLKHSPAQHWALLGVRLTGPLPSTY